MTTRQAESSREPRAGEAPEQPFLKVAELHGRPECPAEVPRQLAHSFIHSSVKHLTPEHCVCQTLCWVLGTQGSCQRHPNIRSGLKLSVRQALTCDLSNPGLSSAEAAWAHSHLLPVPWRLCPSSSGADCSDVTLEASQLGIWGA